MDWPSGLSWLFSICRIFMFNFSGVSLSCLSGQTFDARYWSMILVPIAGIVFSAAAFAMSKVMPAEWKMEINATLSLIGMLASALYITLVKVRVV